MNNKEYKVTNTNKKKIVHIIGVQDQKKDLAVAKKYRDRYIMLDKPFALE